MISKKSLGHGPRVLAFLGLACAVLLMVLAACENEPAQKDEKNILSFKIGGTAGAVYNDKSRITMTLPAETDLAKLKPEIAVSGGASVSPGSGEEVDFSQPTTYVVTAENGTTRSYVVTVVLPESVELESITQLGIAKTLYKVGEEFDLAGITVQGTYSDGSTKIEAITAANVIGYDKDAVGTQSVRITLNGKSTELFSVTVSEVALESIERLGITKTVYQAGEDFDVAGITIQGTYSDGSTQIEAITAENIIGYDKDTVGSQQVCITVNGKSTERFGVTVVGLELIEITTQPAKTSYTKGEAFDLAGMIVQGRYSDGSYKNETITLANIIGYEPNTVGEQRLYVTVNGKTTYNFTVRVSDTSPLAITVTVGSDRKLTVFGIPAGGLKLSRSGVGSPQSVAISVGSYSQSSTTWGDTKCYVDNSQVSLNWGSTLITVDAATANYGSGYAVGKHNIFFSGYQNGVYYSEQIPFEVTW